MLRMLLALIRKEFYQVRRDRNMLRMIFIMPVFQLFVLGYAVNTDVKYIYTAIYDYDNSALSRQYRESFSAGDYFITGNSPWPIYDADVGFRENVYNAVMVIPRNFSRDLQMGKQVKVGMLIDGTNANSASIALGYANIVTSQFNRAHSGLVQPLEMRQTRLYNPQAESIYFMVPGIVASLLTMVTIMLTSMAIVREREIGTLEQLMATPITNTVLILGKTIPFAILGFLEMSLALLLGITWFRIPFAGSWLLLYSISFLYLFTTLGVGMFISTISTSQQQAMFFAWFFAIFSLLTSGFFTPIANMPPLIQYLTYLNPLRYFMIVVRGILMKGAAMDVLYPQVLAMVAFGGVVFTSSWLRFSKRVK